MMLDTFIKITHTEVDAFKAFYLKMREKEGAVYWPLRMSEGEFYEQFIMWQDMGQPTGEEQDD